MTAAVLAAFYIGWSTECIEYGRTYALMTMCISELVRAYSCRSESNTVFKIGVLTNKYMNLATIGCMTLLLIIVLIPGLRDVFSLAQLNLADWKWIAALGVLPLIFGELTKVLKGTRRVS